MNLMNKIIKHDAGVGKVEYRWLLFDRTSRTSSFVAQYDLRSSPNITCWGLYAFPEGVIYPTYCFNSESPTSAVNALRAWAEGECIPMRQAMPRDEWEKLVRLTAYYAWLDEGRPKGRADEHWNAAAEQLADLLKTEYVYVRFEQPEVQASGTHEACEHSDAPESQSDVYVAGGSCGGQGTPATTGKNGVINGVLRSVGSSCLVTPDGRLVAPQEASGQEAGE